MDNIKSVVHQLMQNMSGTKPSPERMEQWLIDQWTAEERKHIQMIGIKDSTVAFQVDSPAWMYHFENHKKNLLKNIKTFQPHISNIKFRLGKIS